MMSNRDGNGLPAQETGNAEGAPREAGDLPDTIKDARERLGHAVEELAAKFDVRGQVQAKAADAKAHLRDTAAGTAAQTREKAAQAVHAAQSAGVQAKEQLTHVAATLTETVQDRAPAQVWKALDRRGRSSRSWVSWAVVGVAVGALAALGARSRAGRLA
ncbi:DUF3618 domain-containing protein [Kitasatospora sp. NPDC098663]|uniref:DUF3618 domain-containing protein n=1 Tax=Kitasatospora sp. NPDC098663 TaxID=3364096 RepID=UPI0038196B82